MQAPAKVVSFANANMMLTRTAHESLPHWLQSPESALSRCLHSVHGVEHPVHETRNCSSILLINQARGLPEVPSMSYQITIDFLCVAWKVSESFPEQEGLLIAKAPRVDSLCRRFFMPCMMVPPLAMAALC